MAASLMISPEIYSHFDETTNTISHIVSDPATKLCAIIDSVLDFDSSSGHASHECADLLIEYIQKSDLEVQWILETHVHADHLSAAPYLQEKLGGKIAIGENIPKVKNVFEDVFNSAETSQKNSKQYFNQLFADEERFRIGKLEATVLFTPGHTPACVSYLIGDNIFVGDTLFMPDYGTARCDFPGGDARTLYQSIRKILSLPEETVVYVCHDYPSEQRSTPQWKATVAEQRQKNIHIHQGVSENDFVAMRDARDATLAMPKLIIPSVQVNINAGHFPVAEENGTQYLKIPVNKL